MLHLPKKHFCEQAFLPYEKVEINVSYGAGGRNRKREEKGSRA